MWFIRVYTCAIEATEFLICAVFNVNVLSVVFLWPYAPTGITRLNDYGHPVAHTFEKFSGVLV